MCRLNGGRESKSREGQFTVGIPEEAESSDERQNIDKRENVQVLDPIYQYTNISLVESYNKVSEYYFKTEDLAIEKLLHVNA